MKRFVIDTNVLVHDPESVFQFEENEVIIPISVVEELDNLKNRQNIVGRNARETIRILDKLGETKSLHDGIKLKTGGILRIEMEFQDPRQLPPGLDRTKRDNLILAVARGLLEQKKNTILVTKDVNLRLKADALNIQAEDYEASKVDIRELFKGYIKVDVDEETLNRFYDNSELDAPETPLHPNEMVLLKVPETRQSALSIYDRPAKKLKPLGTRRANPWGISPRNLEQRFAVEILLQDHIKLVCMMGPAGTGKTLLALASGLQKVVEEKIYERMVVARPIVPMGKDIGYLPGSKEEKLQNWMQPITDNLDFLFAQAKEEAYAYVQEQGIIEVEALTYIRGRSLPKCFMIIDEAQNLSPHEVKTIVTRVGEGTKIIFTGDPFQIDHQYLDEFSNGLSYLAQRFLNEKIAANIVLMKGERSPLASLAAQLL